MRINDLGSIFLNHASLRKHLRELNMAQWDNLSGIKTGSRSVRQAAP